jgi:hypothetical protein
MSRLIRFGAGGALLVALGLLALGCDHHSSASSTPVPVAGVGTPVAEDARPVAETCKPVARLPADNSQLPASDRATLPSASEPIGAGEAVAQTSAQEPASPPVKDAAKTRPPADRGPARPGDAEKITFDDLNLGMQQDMVFRPFLVTDRVKDLEGKRVRITGFIHAGAAGIKGIREFVLLKNTECKFGAGGQADHLAMVYLTPGQTTKYQVEAVKVEGVLKVKPFEGPDGNTWSVYDLTDAKLVQ